MSGKVLNAEKGHTCKKISLLDFCNLIFPDDFVYSFTLDSTLKKYKDKTNTELLCFRTDNPQDLVNLVEEMNNGTNFLLVDCLGVNGLHYDCYISLPNDIYSVISEDIDCFWIDKKNKYITCVYYNPDSVSGGQYVKMEFSYEDIKKCFREIDYIDEFFDKLYPSVTNTLIDKGTDEFIQFGLDYLLNCKTLAFRVDRNKTRNIMGYLNEKDAAEKLFDLVYTRDN